MKKKEIRLMVADEKLEVTKNVREQRKAAAEIDAFSDEEIDAMVDGEPDKDDLTPGENAFLDAIAGLY